MAQASIVDVKDLPILCQRKLAAALLGLYKNKGRQIVRANVVSQATDILTGTP